LDTRAAIQAHGSPDVALPAGPPLFRFADATETARTLESSGFSNVRTTVLKLTWHAERSQDLLELIYKSIVRAPILIETAGNAGGNPIGDRKVRGAAET
jgi:hypothetical protein